jgi:hypothetical protein
MVLRAMAEAGSDAPGYKELDGTKYRILDFHGDAVVPKGLKEKFAGAIAEWANDSDEVTALTMYTSRDEFGHDFARVDIAADRIV